MTHLKLKKLQKGDITQQHIDTSAICWWVIIIIIIIMRNFLKWPK